MSNFLLHDCSNVNRGESETVFENENTLIKARAGIAALFGSGREDLVCFQMNATHAINNIVGGLFSDKDHILISPYEHNAVVRALTVRNIDFTPLYPGPDFSIDLEKSSALIKKNTKAVISTGASNIIGQDMDIKALSAFARANGLLFFVDAAQRAPHLPLSLSDCDGIAFTGHKGLLGPQGTGGMVLSEKTASMLKPVFGGGTGSLSESYYMPQFYPDRFEAGTQNIVGIVGLAAALDYTLTRKEELHRASMKATEGLMEGFSEIKGIKVLNRHPATPVVSVYSERLDVAELGTLIEEKSGIETRVGLHCAPLAHKTAGTYPRGVLRFSPGHATTEEEVEKTVSTVAEAVNELLR
jgi:Selenocysteine lyase